MKQRVSKGALAILPVRDQGDLIQGDEVEMLNRKDSGSHLKIQTIGFAD